MDNDRVNKIAKNVVSRKISSETKLFVSGSQVIIQVNNTYSGSNTIEDVKKAHKETDGMVSRIGKALEKLIEDAGIEFYESGQGETWISGRPNHPADLLLDGSYAWDFFGLMENVPAMVELLGKRGYKKEY